ncbi:hypothetical protein MMC12_006672 [Toensbergia leucococca]|nr:hypothetical protein [Toensbergia leucococca]
MSAFTPTDVVSPDDTSIRSITPLPMTPSHSESFPFLELSAEIRNIVYDNLLIIDPLTAEGAHPQILATCSQINNEASGILYTSERILFRVFRGEITIRACPLQLPTIIHRQFPGHFNLSFNISSEFARFLQWATNFTIDIDHDIHAHLFEGFVSDELRLENIHEMSSRLCNFMIENVKPRSVRFQLMANGLSVFDDDDKINVLTRQTHDWWRRRLSPERLDRLSLFEYSLLEPFMALGQIEHVEFAGISENERFADQFKELAKSMMAPRGT